MKKQSYCKKFTCNLPLDLFDTDARKVSRRLSTHKHTTYFVGGCVRDILLECKPKDFDLVTSARPGQIRRLFRNSRVIGKRFKLVHVLFYEKIIEVATFRSAPKENGNGKKTLLLKNDNQYGTDEEDAWRRDFTINALYYDLENSRLLDYVDGVEDLRYRKIRTIGEPDIRFQEDPVRIIRAVKLATRLKFDIVPEARQAIIDCIPFLSQVPAPRMLLELTKILQEGVSLPCFCRLAHTRAFNSIAPDFQNVWNNQDCFSHHMLCHILKKLDKITRNKREKFTEATLLSVFCFPQVVSKKHFSGKKKKSSINYAKLQRIALEFNIPRRTLEKIENIIRIYPLLENPDRLSNKNMKKIIQSEQFYEALDFLSVFYQGEPNGRKIHHFWKKYAKRYFDH